MVIFKNFLTSKTSDTWTCDMKLCDMKLCDMKNQLALLNTTTPQSPIFPKSNLHFFLQIKTFQNPKYH